MQAKFFGNFKMNEDSYVQNIQNVKFLSSLNKIASSSNMRKRCVKNSKFTIKDKRKKVFHLKAWPTNRNEWMLG